MPKIVSLKLRWDPLAGTDGFFVYFAPHEAGPNLSYDSPHVDAKLPQLDADGKHVVWFKDFPELAGLAEGEYDFAVAGYDKAGNVGDLTEIESVPLDLTAPGPVTGVEVVGE